MRNYQKLLQQIEYAIYAIDTSGADEIVISQAAQFHCVRRSGVIEQAIKDTLSRALSKGAHVRTGRYVNKCLDSFQNPKPEKILDLYSKIDVQWANDIENYWEDEIKDSIGTIVGNRNRIAHGETSTITIAQIKKLEKNVRKFCEYIEKYAQ